MAAEGLVGVAREVLAVLTAPDRPDEQHEQSQVQAEVVAAYWQWIQDDGGPGRARNVTRPAWPASQRRPSGVHRESFTRIG